MARLPPDTGPRHAQRSYTFVLCRSVAVCANTPNASRELTVPCSDAAGCYTRPALSRRPRIFLRGARFESVASCVASFVLLLFRGAGGTVRPLQANQLVFVPGIIQDCTRRRLGLVATSPHDAHASFARLLTLEANRLVLTNQKLCCDRFSNRQE